MAEEKLHLSVCRRFECLLYPLHPGLEDIELRPQNLQAAHCLPGVRETSGVLVRVDSTVSQDSNPRERCSFPCLTQIRSRVPQVIENLMMRLVSRFISPIKHLTNALNKRSQSIEKIAWGIQVLSARAVWTVNNFIVMMMAGFRRHNEVVCPINLGLALFSGLIFVSFVVL